MPKELRRVVALGPVLVVAVTGCAELSQNPKTAIGTLGGAAVSGLIAGAAGAWPRALHRCMTMRSDTIGFGPPPMGLDRWHGPSAAWVVAHVPLRDSP